VSHGDETPEKRTDTMAKQAIILALIEEMLSDICEECDESADLRVRRTVRRNAMFISGTVSR